MREGWVETTLGDVTKRRVDFTPVVPDAEYTILGVRRSGWGFVERDPIRGRDQKFSKLMRVEEGDLVYRTITAFEAPSGVVGSKESGHFVTPQTFPVFRINGDELLPRFMRLLTTWPHFHEEMASRCTGTVLRRKTLSIGAFESIPLNLPPLPEQRRIVDLIGAVDDAIDAAEEALSKERKLAAEIGKNLSGDRVDLGSLLSRIDAGRSPSGVDRLPREGERAVLKVSAVGDGAFRQDEVKVVAEGEQLPRGSELSAEDILMVRANGVLSRVGVVCQVPLDYPNLHLSDKTLRLVPRRDKVEPPWLVAALSAPAARKQIEALTTGSHMRNISQKAIKQIQIPAASLEEQQAIVALLVGVGSAIASQEGNLASLRALRSNLLTTLLSGEHEIPESYDELLEAS